MRSEIKIDMMKEIRADMKDINEALLNHVTGTDKKIDAFQKDVTEIKKAVLNKI